jgi:hypothetical protein
MEEATGSLRSTSGSKTAERGCRPVQTGKPLVAGLLLKVQRDKVSKGVQHLAMDQSKFTRIATQLMDVIDSQYGDDAKLESVMILAAVERGGTTHLHYPAERRHHVPRSSGNA